MPTRRSKKIYLGSLPIGGDAPILVQSMTNTDTRDVEATRAQIEALKARGCEAVRVAVPDDVAANALFALVKAVDLPVIADIHFDYRLALKALEAGCAGIRINPGNIGSAEHVKSVCAAAKERSSVIRIGVNSGSVEKELLERFGGPTPQAMVESALSHVHLLEEYGFEAIKISLKSSSVLNTLEAYRLLHRVCDYPLHIGITEAGGLMRGTVKSAVGLGILLHEGIGDTIRVSLTADPTEEVTVAYEILRALGLRQRGPEIISCPTCGRTEIDLFAMVSAVEKAVATARAPIKIAVMGCVVNGPGEAREADIGLAGGRNKGVIFRKGEIVQTVRGQEALLQAFLAELERVLSAVDAAKA